MSASNNVTACLLMMIWCFTINSTALNDTLLVWESDWDNNDVHQPKPKQQQTMKSRYNRQDQANSVFSVFYLKPFDERNNNNNENNNNENNNNEIAVIDINSNEGQEFLRLF